MSTAATWWSSTPTGILARPGRNLAISTVELGQVAADAAPTPDRGRTGRADRVCEQALGAMTPAGPGTPTTSRCSSPRSPSRRRRCTWTCRPTTTPSRVCSTHSPTWLETMRVRDLDHIVVQHAVDELVSNVVDHAYMRRPARLPVGSPSTPRCSESGDLRDPLRRPRALAGAPAPDEGAGRGLTMVRGMVDRLLVERDEQGTVATVEHRLSPTGAHADRRRTAAGRRAERRTATSRSRLTSGRELACSCVGSLDAATCGRPARGALDDRAGVGSGGASTSSGVTPLPSSAVQALHHARRDAADRGQDLVLLRARRYDGPARARAGPAALRAERRRSASQASRSRRGRGRRSAAGTP